MRLSGHKVDDADGTSPAEAKESPFAIRGNTRTVLVWHLKESPAERKGNGLYLSPQKLRLTIV